MGDILTYIFKRIASVIPVLVGVSLIAFLLGVMAPGDPALEILTMDGMTNPTDEEVEMMRAELGLDRPLAVQYLAWVSNVLQGDLGRSYITSQLIYDELTKRLPITFSIALIAVVLAVAVGIPLGIIMAVKRGTILDDLGRFAALTFISVPGFWLSFMLISLFSEKLQWLPTSGSGSWKHLIMPAFILAAGSIGVIMRLNRATLIEELNKNYILTARAKGLPNYRVVMSHAFLNSVMPVITYLGNYFGAILGGSVIIESIFSIPGIGSYVISGIYNRDYPVIQGYVLLAGLIFVSFNLIVDLSYLLLNPQIRLGKEK